MLCPGIGCALATPLSGMGDIWIATNASVNSLANFHAVMGPQV